MKNSCARWAVSLFMVVLAATGLSCSNKGTEKGRVVKDKQMEQHIMELEQAKNIMVARVNNSPINMKDLLERLNDVSEKQTSIRGERTPEMEQELRRAALDILIFRELAVQEALKRGMEVTRGSVDQTIAQLKANMGSEDAFKAFLNQTGHTAETLRTVVERDQLFDMIVAEEVFKKVNVDEKLVKNVYMKDKDKFFAPATIGVDDIIVVNSGDESAAMKKAEEISTLLRKNNNDISKLPQDKSVVVTHRTISRNESPAIFDAASKLKEGTPSGIIKQAEGLHIIKVTEKRPAARLPLEQVRGLIEKDLQESLTEKRRKEWDKELKKGAKIEVSGEFLTMSNVRSQAPISK